MSEGRGGKEKCSNDAWEIEALALREEKENKFRKECENKSWTKEITREKRFSILEDTVLRCPQEIRKRKKKIDSERREMP